MRIGPDGRSMEITPFPLPWSVTYASAHCGVEFEERRVTYERRNDRGGSQHEMG